MKYVKITPGSVKPEELFEKLNQQFGNTYKVTNFHGQVTVAKDKAIGCKVNALKKRIMISGNFATHSRMALALFILIIGGIMIPMAIYLFVYKPKFDAIEKEVYDYLSTQYVV
jgi:hypothetical protein